MPDLAQSVIDHCKTLTLDEAAKFYGTSKGSISNWLAERNPPTLEAAQRLLDSGTIGAPMTDLEEPKWEGRNLMVLLPVYRSFCWGTHYTLFSNYARYGADKIGLIMQHRTLIYEARNILVDKFLKTGAEWALFIDDDMILPCGSATVMNKKFGARLPDHLAAVNTFSRLMRPENSDKHILGALYFGRGRLGKGQFAEAFESEVENRESHVVGKPTIRKVGWVGTGCMRIHRSVFERLKAESARWPEIVPRNPEKPWGFFTPSGVGIGEDVSFCRRAAQIGISSYVDTGIVCSHVGDEYFTYHNTRP